jgi:very-short-patch-repair endonuclease
VTTTEDNPRLAERRRLLALTDRVESEAEWNFWVTYAYHPWPALTGIEPQHTVLGYRLDFAVPERKFAVEVDGYAHHSDRHTFVRDRWRHRQLEIEGWRIVRFAGKEVMDDPRGCVEEAARAAVAFGRTT